MFLLSAFYLSKYKTQKLISNAALQTIKLKLLRQHFSYKEEKNLLDLSKPSRSKHATANSSHAENDLLSF
jgi:hypothetical protein